MKTIRCSSLPMLFSCAHSQDDSEILIDGANGAADLGTAAHDAMRSVVAGLPVDLSLLSLRHGVEESDLGPLVWYGRKAWEELRASFPNPETEVEVQYGDTGLHLVGHVDLVSRLNTAIRFIDWKTGRKEETDYYAQLAGYAACLIAEGYETATSTVVWLRSQTVETYTFTRADASTFVGRIAAHLDGPYRHGEHCGYCRRSHDCPALIAASRRDMAIFSAATAIGIEAEVASAPPDVLVMLRRRAKTLEKFVASLDASIHRRVMSEGPLDSGDGYTLELGEENGKREIDTMKAWPILQEHLTDDELAACVTVSAKSVDDLVGKKAGRGNGAEAKRKLAAELEAAGAVTQGKIVKLREIRQPKQFAIKEESK